MIVANAAADAADIFSENKPGIDEGSKPARKPTRHLHRESKATLHLGRGKRPGPACVSSCEGQRRHDCGMAPDQLEH